MKKTTVAKVKKTAPFVMSDCNIPTVWCGLENKFPTKPKDGSYYYKTGNRYECMQKGFGAGMHTERNDNLPANSLQQIKYVGEKHEKDFKKAGIATLDALKKEMGKKSTADIEKTLKKILTKKDGKLDARAYNCVIVYLYKHGVQSVPACQKIKV